MEDIRVKNFGSVYTLKSESISKNNIMSLSQELNTLMQHHAGQMNNINPLQVSILTALNLLEENHLLKSKLSAVNLCISIPFSSIPDFLCPEDPLPPCP